MPKIKKSPNVSIDFNEDIVVVSGKNHEIYEPHGVFSFNYFGKTLHVVYGHEQIKVIDDEGRLVAETYTR